MTADIKTDGMKERPIESVNQSIIGDANEQLDYVWSPVFTLFIQYSLPKRILFNTNYFQLRHDSTISTWAPPHD